MEERSDNKKGVLYSVATPIGNMEDVTYRAVQTLHDVDVVLCEDTRVTRKLLARYDITTQTLAVHQHTRQNRLAQIVERMCAGENMAIVTDAGTPGISDPGNQLVAVAIEAGVSVVPIPGASAIGAIISVAGIDVQTFSFWAYPPHKKGRQTFFTKIVNIIQKEKRPVIYYDSVHRVLKNMQLLEDISTEMGCATHVIVGRELTKMHEEVVRGTVTEVREHFEVHAKKVRGEFVVIAYSKE